MASTSQSWNVQTNHAPMQTVNPMHLFGSSQRKGQQQAASSSNLPAMPFQLPAHILQDALALSTPVNATDEPLLCEHIIQGIKRGENYKSILNGLHGRNGHSASLWKDYYLEHKDKLDTWVNMCLRNMQSVGPSIPAEPVVKRDPSASNPMPPPSRTDGLSSSSKAPHTVKKPSTFKSSNDGSRSPSSSASHKQTATPTVPPSKHRVEKKERKLSPRHEIAQAAGGRRATMNSLTVGLPIFDKRLPAPHAEIKIPEPPSRSPSPPPESSLQMKGRGYKYTDEDDAYFVKFIQWHMGQNPKYTKTELCEMIAEKASHHTAASWLSHWHQIHDLLDKIMASYRDEGASQSPQSGSQISGSFVPAKRPVYRDTSCSEDQDSDDDASEGIVQPVRKRARRKDANSTRAKPTKLTDDERYAMAKFIAQTPHCEDLNLEAWATFSEQFPRRTAVAWHAHYKRKEQALRDLADKIKAELQTEGELA